MERRDFLRASALGVISIPLLCFREKASDVVIVGGGTGGCAAALAALESGCTVVITEPTDWIGGQLTQQGVPPDEHRWVESFGATRTYRQFRQMLRGHYVDNYPINPGFDAQTLNPGECLVSRLCAEPTAAHKILEQIMAPYVMSGQLTILPGTEPVDAQTSGDRILSVAVQNAEGVMLNLVAKYFIDASEDGGLLPLAGVEFVEGAEPETGELHASPNPSPDNVQSATWCFALEYREGEDHTIEKPATYDYWVDYTPSINPSWPGKLLSLTYSHPITLEPRPASFDPRPGAETQHFNLWTYRRLMSPGVFADNRFPYSISLVNWPQNDYMEGDIIKSADHLEGARQLSLSLMYWLQTEVPREDGGMGWPGLRPCGEVLGSSDGLAKAAYIRESRRIRSRFTVLEGDVGREARGMDRAARYEDSVGIGYYRIDLHPSTGGDNYIDVDSLPFEIPLGALIPVRVKNLLPACKNIGTTHITNGCYRLHPVEWNIGEAAGALAAYSINKGENPEAVYESGNLKEEYQRLLEARGVELHWPDDLE